MSSFMVEAAHINALLTFYGAHCGRTLDTNKATDCGRMLLAENVRSVLTRYPQHSEAHLLRRMVELYEYTADGHELSPEDIISMCDCFDYQACETDDYDVTEAADLVERIRRAAYAELTWPRDGVWHYTGTD